MADDRNNNYTELSVIFPSLDFSNTSESKWFNRYSMYIDVLSTYDRGVDFVYQISSANDGKNWSKTLSEVTAEGDNRQIASEIEDDVDVNTNGEFTSTRGNFVNFGMDLGRIGFPSHYNILFSAVGLNLDHEPMLSCVIFDATNFVSLPPPTFGISPISSEPLNFEQNEKRQLEIQVKSQAQSSASIFLFTNKTDSMEVNFSPNPISISPSGTAISLLAIDTKNATPYTHTIPIFANISFPVAVSVNLGSGEKTVVYNPQVINITKTANLSIQ